MVQAVLEKKHITHELNKRGHRNIVLCGRGRNGYKMKFAAMNYHYIRYPLVSFLDKMACSPFQYIELYAAAPHLNIFDYSLSKLLEVNKEIRKRNLKILCLTPENCVYPVNLSSQEKELRNSSLRYYQRAVDTAEFFDAGRVQICLGNGYFNQSKEEAWKLGRDSMEQIAAYADKKGIVLILEELMTTTSNVINTSMELAQMLNEIGAYNVVGMMDLSQMSWAGETPEDYFKNLGDKLQHIHFNDRAHLVPGDGDLPMKKYYDAITAHDYEGVCSFEICDRRYFCDPDQAIDGIVKWFRENTDVFN